MKRLSLLSVAVFLFLNEASFAQGKDPDIDPVIADALMDASKASTPSEDPLKGVVVDDVSKAKEAAIKMKQQGNNVKVVSPAQPTQAVVKPKPLPPKGPEMITPEEAEMLRKLEAKNSSSAVSVEDKDAPSSAASATPPAKKKKAIYEPLFQDTATGADNFKVERDSSKVLTKRMSVTDVMTVKLCFSSALSIVLDQDVQDEFQTIEMDDKAYFNALPYSNNRGALVRLIKKVEEGGRWESAIRFTRKSDDKTYLINLVGLACPASGLNPFVKSIILQDKTPRLQANSKSLVPEDTIIQLSKGMPRIQKNRIRIYDMLASSGSEWVNFGVEVQYPNPSEDSSMPKMVVLDSLQVEQINSKLEYLPLHSRKATDIRGVQTLRFNLKVNINKNYIVKRRYIYLMFLDQKAGHYQYLKVDTLPYFMNLLKRGFEL